MLNDKPAFHREVDQTVDCLVRLLQVRPHFLSLVVSMLMNIPMLKLYFFHFWQLQIFCLLKRL
ncbi:hypothetical protein D3C86_1952170 [compost metagenome]